jgi:biopolymer transport protein ExbD
MIRPPPPTPLTLNLAPMVDVMMCLLIFFMLATKMVERERTRIDLPAAESADDTRPDASRRRLTVNIVRNTADRPSYRLGDEELSYETLLSTLAAARRDNPDLTVVIRADKTLAYHDVETLLVGCTQRGVTRVSLGALRERTRVGP